MATNTPPNGAFRGFGAPQTLFAAELHIEKIAAALELDSLTSCGAATWCGADRRSRRARRCARASAPRSVLDTVVARSRYRELQREHARWNRDAANPTWRGAGLALVFHGAGFTGRGEVMLQSRAAVLLTRDGRFKALAASTEMGQGATTTFAQMTADALGVDIDRVEIENPDTWKVPNSGPTVASRT